MEEKRPKAIPGSTIAFAIATIILGGLSGYLVYKNTELENKVNADEGTISSVNYHIEKVDDEIYYVIDEDYEDEYDIQYVDFNDNSSVLKDTKDEVKCGDKCVRENYCSKVSDFAVRKIMSYDEYEKYVEKWGLKQRYYEAWQNYAVFSYCNSGTSVKARLAEAEDMGGAGFTLYVWDDISGSDLSCVGYTIIVPTYHSPSYGVNIIPLYEEDDVPDGEAIPIRPTPTDPYYTVDKPMIYLYPEREQSVEVKLNSPERLTVSYPAYVDSWNVVARPDGTLKDKNGRELYGLYYESLPKTEFKVEDEGFVVIKEDSAKFLEEKLAKLGLNEKEAEEFIVYWLPKMNEKKYNYVRFASSEEIENNMKLSISPKPDTTIRIWMVLKPLDEKIEVTEQKINPVKRSGFVAVEWGGIKL